MTMERAVNLLSQDSEETLVSAALYIQNQCLQSNDARKMVRLLFLNGPVFHCVGVVVKTAQNRDKTLARLKSIETKTRPRLYKSTKNTLTFCYFANYFGPFFKKHQQLPYFLLLLCYQPVLAES